MPKFDEPLSTGNASCCGWPAPTTSASSARSSTTLVQTTSDSDPKGLLSHVERSEQGGYSRNCSVWTVSAAASQCICTACVAMIWAVSPQETVDAYAYLLASSTMILDGVDKRAQNADEVAL